MTTTSCTAAFDTLLILPMKEPCGSTRMVSEPAELVGVERKRRFSETMCQSEVDRGSKTSRFADGERHELLMGNDPVEKVEDVEVDVAQHVEVRHSDEIDSDGMDEDEAADGDAEAVSDQRVYPCPMTSSGGRPRKHPALPPKYRCEYCGRGCQKPSVLAKHIRAHTNERPYPCELCGFAFKTKSNLYKHSKSKTHHDKLNSVLQAKRLGTLADCNPQLHVVAVARSADSESPDSDNRPHDTALRSLRETMPTDGRKDHGELNFSTSDDDSHSHSQSHSHLHADCAAECIITHESPTGSDTLPQASLQSNVRLSPAERGARPVEKSIDVNRAVKAKLRSHIEQKHFGEKANNHDGSASPHSPSYQSLQSATTIRAESNSSVPISHCINDSARNLHPDVRVGASISDRSALETDEEHDSLRRLADPNCSQTDSADELALRSRPSGKLPLDNLVRYHTTPTLQSTLFTTWSYLTKPPLCSVIDTKPTDSVSCNSESKRTANSVTSDMILASNLSEDCRHKYLALTNEPIAISRPNSTSQSSIDVLIKATDLISASSNDSVRNKIKSERPPYMQSSLDLLAAAAEAASKLDEVFATGVPSPAEHVDIVNANAGTSAALVVSSPRSKLQCSFLQPANAAAPATEQHAKSYAKEQLSLQLEPHDEAPYRCGICRQSFSKLSKLQCHQAAENHYPSAASEPTTKDSVSVSNVVKREQTSPKVNCSTENSLVHKVTSHSAPQASNRLPLGAPRMESASTENRTHTNARLLAATNAPPVQENPKLYATSRRQDTVLTTKGADTQQQADNAIHSLVRADGNNAAQQPNQKALTKRDEQLRPAIPLSTVSVSHIPYLATSNAGLAPPVPSIVDPQNIVLLGGTQVGMPVGLSNGPMIAAFALPFGGYTLLPAPGGLYVAAQPQANAVAPTASIGNTSLLLPSTNTTALHISNAVAQATESTNHSIELAPQPHSSASVTESNSDRDNLELESPACTASRPFRCDTCKRGFRVQGHLNKHMRSKIHMENVASTDSRLSTIVKQ